MECSWMREMRNKSCRSNTQCFNLLFQPLLLCLQSNFLITEFILLHLKNNRAIKHTSLVRSRLLVDAWEVWPMNSGLAISEGSEPSNYYLVNQPTIAQKSNSAHFRKVFFVVSAWTLFLGTVHAIYHFRTQDMTVEGIRHSNPGVEGKKLWEQNTLRSLIVSRSFSLDSLSFSASPLSSANRRAASLKIFALSNLACLSGLITEDNSRNLWLRKIDHSWDICGKSCMHVWVHSSFLHGGMAKRHVVNSHTCHSVYPSEFSHGKLWTLDQMMMIHLYLCTKSEPLQMKIKYGPSNKMNNMSKYCVKFVHGNTVMVEKL